MTSFDSLPKLIQDWLYQEQCVNERILNTEVSAPIRRSGRSVLPHFRPENRKIWELEVVFFPRDQSRGYGPYRKILQDKLNFHIPPLKEVAFIHPQTKKAYEPLIQENELVRTNLLATPTSSYRSLLVWNPENPDSPLIIKVSLDLLIGGINRKLREDMVLRGYVGSLMFEAISLEDRRRGGFDFFPEYGGAVWEKGGFGFAIRDFPSSWLKGSEKSQMIPLFSLFSIGRDKRVLLEPLIKRSPLNTEDFLREHFIRPYVKMLSSFLFREGISVGGHSQNILCEIREGSLTGKFFLRDIGDSSVLLPLRVLLGKELSLPRHMYRPNPELYLALAFHTHHAFWRIYCDVIGRGLYGPIWEIHHSLKRFFPSLSLKYLKLSYLEAWQQACQAELGIFPAIAPGRKRIYLSEAIEEYILGCDWTGRIVKIPPKLDVGLSFSLAPLREAKLYTPRRAISQMMTSSWGTFIFNQGKPIAFTPKSVST